MSDPDVFFGTMIAVIFGAIFLAGFIISIFFLFALQGILELISPENRKVPPGRVWLMLIPVFNLVWQFFLVGYVSDSIGNEWRSRKLAVNEKRPLHGLGIALCISTLFYQFILPILLVIYWVKLSRYKSTLESMQSAQVLDKF